MTRFSRVMMGAALVLGLATTTRAAEPDKLLPADTDTVAMVNLKQIIDSDIVKKFALGQIKQALEGQDVKQLLTDLGLDPLKDVEKIVVGSMETQFKKGAEPKFLIVVYGKFDAEKIYKTAEAEAKKDAEKFAMVKDGDTVMFKFQPPGEGQPAVYTTVVNDKTVVAASDKKLVTAAIKAADASKPAPIKKELAALIAKLDDKASVNIASLLKGKLDEVKLPGGGGMIELGGLEKAIPKIETAAISIKIGADIAVDVTIGMKDEDAAGDMRNAIDDVVRDLKKLAEQFGDLSPQIKPLGDVLATVKVTSKNKDVTVTGKVTGDNIGKMVPTPKKKKD